VLLSSVSLWHGRSIPGAGSGNVDHLVEPRAGAWLILLAASPPGRWETHGATARGVQGATVSTNLPTPLTRFVGRQAELAETAALLAEYRLVTLTGPGGAGKTRLALQLAAAVAEDFPDGVWFVDLAPLSGGQFVWDQVAMALGVKELAPGSTLAQAVASQLASRRVLLVLDNCEHLVAAAAEVVGILLAASPALKVVTTSREPLGVDGEVTWTVPPLAEPDGVELFLLRARAAWPQLHLGEGDAQAVRVICRRLDGLPLAIELAAARARALAPSRIAAHLDDHFRVLSRGPRTAPGRQATLRASFEWSYQLLSEPERALLGQLSVFAGGFDLEAALAVCPAASIELLAGLVDRSLLMVEDRGDRAAGAEPRYRLLEPIRRFAADHLADAAEAKRLWARHRDHYLRLAEAAEPNLVGPDGERWRARLRTEQDNLRAAMAFSRDHGDTEALARMVVAVGWFWVTPGRWAQLTEWQAWLQTVADRAGELPLWLAARIRNFQCLAFLSTGSVGEVPALANQALALARAAGDQPEEGLALALLGYVAGFVGGAEAMRPYLEQALPLLGSADSVAAQLFLPYWLATFVVLRWFQSDPEEPRRLAEEAVALANASADRRNQLFTNAIAATTALIQGRLADAAQRFQTVIAAGRQDNDSNFMRSLIGLAWVHMFRGDLDAARAAVAEARAVAQTSWAEAVSVRTLEPIAGWVLGWIELASGNLPQARETLAAAAGGFRSSVVPRWAALPLVLLAQAQLALGALDQAGASLQEATALARQGTMTLALGHASQLQARLCARRGDLHQAEQQAHQALGLAREAGDQLGLVEALELLAQLAAAQDSPTEAVRLWAAAQAQREALGYARFPIDRPAHDAAVAKVRQTLGAEGFAGAWADGAQLSPEAAVAYAARGRGQRRRPTTGWASLTPTELEVVRLVAQHLTNPQIASRLFVSRATVKTHLVHIFAKLGIDSRSQLAAEAIRRGIAQ
jgi:predicted ATPase/DNA-binding CsgD family transcriptional regulator